MPAWPVPPHRRPQYPPTERMAILELKAARGWSLEQTAKAFLVTAATIASWMKRLDEDGPDALVQFRQPVNKFPEFVRTSSSGSRRSAPSMGKVKIAQTLARAGLHLGATTVGRMLKGKPQATNRLHNASPKLTRMTRRHGQVPQPRLARGPDRRADRRLLGHLAALRVAAVLAVLLLGGGRRSTTSHGA